MINKLTSESLRLIFNGLQENSRILDPVYEGWPLWCIVKDKLYNHLLSKIVNDKEEKFIIHLLERTDAILRQFINVPISKLLWFKSNATLGQKKYIKPRAVLLIDGFLRYKSEDNNYIYPYGEEIFLLKERKFDLFIIEKNNRRKRKKNIISKLDIKEDFTSFPGDLKNLLFNIKNNKLEKAKSELLSIIKENIIESSELYKEIREIINSKLMNRLLYSFSIEKRKFARLLGRINPFCVMITAPHGHLAVIAASKELGIPVIEFQHGVIDKYEPLYNWSSAILQKKDKLLIPDKVFLWGQYWVDQLKEIQYGDENNLFPFGHTRIYKYKQNYKGVKRGEVLSNEKIIIVFTTQRNTYQDTIAFFEETFRLAEKENLPLLVKIKLHPHDDNEYKYYKTIQNRYPQFCNVYYHKDVDLYTLFISSHVHISIFSASILESFELGTPTAILKLPGYEHFIHLVEKNIIKCIDSPAGLILLTKEIINNSNVWKEWCKITNKYEGYFFANDPNNSYLHHLNSMITNASKC
jgi:hypothetical protein